MLKTFRRKMEDAIEGKRIYFSEWKDGTGALEAFNPVTPKPLKTLQPISPAEKGLRARVRVIG